MESECSKLTEEQKKLVEDNYALVWYMIRKFCKEGQYEEYHGYAAVGLCNAAKTYDSSNSATFATYASKCIYNEIMKYKRIIGKPNKNGFSLLSFNQVVDEESNMTLEDKISDGSSFSEDYENSEAIQKAFEKLRKKYDVQPLRNGVNRFEVFEAYYFGELTQREISAKFGISQVYISRTVNKMKRELAELLKKQGIDI